MNLSASDWYKHLPQVHPIGETFEDGFRKGFIKAMQLVREYQNNRIEFVNEEQ